MRTTYYKILNVIKVELTIAEAEGFGLSRQDPNTDSFMEEEVRMVLLTIPCSSSFYQKSQRQRGGRQEWDKDMLRHAVRAGVANALVPYEGQIDPEGFSEYRRRWSAVNRGLNRNVRLLFPGPKYRGERLSREEFKYRQEFRRMHNL